MFSYRTIAGIGAAALAIMALSRAGRQLRKRNSRIMEGYIKKTARRVEGIVRRRTASVHNVTNDVI